MKGLDHIVLCVNDLNEAADRYRKLGFTVTPRAQHPFGTHNCIVQLDGFFLELLTVAEPDKIPPAQPGSFSFARFNQTYLAKQQGASMLVMDTEDFRKDNVLARQAGLDTYQPFEFSRKAVLPGKKIVEVSFGMNFVTDQATPMAAFFTCQQFQPEFFWNNDYQRHDNTAREIIEVCLVTRDPTQLVPFMENFTGCSISSSDQCGAILQTQRGRVAILTPAAFEKRYQATSPDVSNGAQLAGFTIGVKQGVLEPVSLFGTAILFE